MVWVSLVSIAGLLCLGRTGAFSAVGCPPRSLRLSKLSAVSSSSDRGDEDRGDVVGPRLLLHQQRRQFVIQSIATTGIVSGGAALSSFSEPAFADDEDQQQPAQSPADDDAIIDPSIDLPKITQKVYLDVKFGSYKPKQLVIGLFGDVMPRTVENFLTLCTNTEGPSYNGSTFYRVLSGMSIQGGAIGNNSGKSGTSAFEDGRPFPPDNFKVRHTKAGLVSAVRALGGDIDSRFFIQTENDAGWADDRYAAFGIVLGGEDGSSGGGMDLVKRISRVDVKPPQNSPKDPVMIVGCGIVEG